MAYYFIDESGHGNEWTFVAIKVDDPKAVTIIIKKWRLFMKKTVKNFQANEFKYNNASYREREKILKEITDKKVSFWAIIHTNYQSHKLNYVESCAALLNHCEISEQDTVIAVDRVEKNSKHMDKHLKEIKEVIAMEKLNISWETSEKEKGIQVADALAGVIGRRFCLGKDVPLFAIVNHLLQKDVIKIESV